MSRRSTNTTRLLAATAAFLIALTGFPPAPAAAQSVVDRTPNMSGSWVGDDGRLYFNFLHRFDATEPPTRKVKNSPTFLLGYGIGGWSFLGVQYVTSSDLVASHPNEWEVLGRVSPLSTSAGAPVDVGLTAAYNEAAESFDSELSVGVPVGRFAFMGSARFFSDAYGTEESRWAVGGGVRIHILDELSLVGDIVTPTDRRAGEEHGWGAGVQIAIPFTPHTLSLQAANTNSATLQGSSKRSGATRYGFEFTIPITPSRYFGDRPETGTPSAPRTGEADMEATDTVRIPIVDFEFQKSSVTVNPGTYVLWVNEGDVPHTSTSDDAVWDSRLLAPGESYGRIFTEAGEYPYHCTPHPFMTGVVVVEGGGGG